MKIQISQKIIILLFLVAFSPLFLISQDLTLGSGLILPLVSYADESGFFNNLLDEAFSRLGLTAEIISSPPGGSCRMPMTESKTAVSSASLAGITATVTSLWFPNPC